jgi:hypothetical protein
MPASYSHHPQTYGSLDRGLRAGDSDREAVAGILREQHLAGRLETDEFQERLDRCYAAKTYRELDELVADLPRAEPTRPIRRPPWWTMIAAATAAIAALVLTGGHLLWLAVPLFFIVGRPLLWRSGRFGSRLSGCGTHHRPATDGYV